MKMLDLTISTPDFPQSESFIELVRSIISKNFGSHKDINSVQVEIAKVADERIPFKTTIDLKLHSSDDTIQTESSSAHYLSSFTQALSRMERQLGRRA